MKAPTAVAFSLVFVLGAVSTALGFIAETKRINISDVRVSRGICIYPSTPALPLGLAAAAALLVSEIIVGAYTRCVCCKRGNGDYKPCALVCSIISWIAAVIGFLLFLAGAGLHSQREDEPIDVRPGGVYHCPYMRRGLFAVAAGLALLSTILGLLTISITDSFSDDRDQAMAPSQPPPYYDHRHQQGGIAMAQPQMLSPTNGSNGNVRGQHQSV